LTLFFARSGLGQRDREVALTRLKKTLASNSEHRLIILLPRTTHRKGTDIATQKWSSLYEVSDTFGRIAVSDDR
jgi:hypothetical protein